MRLTAYRRVQKRLFIGLMIAPAHWQENISGVGPAEPCVGTNRTPGQKDAGMHAETSSIQGWQDKTSLPKQMVDSGIRACRPWT